MLIANPRQPTYKRLHALSFEMRRLNESSSALLGAALIPANPDISPAQIFRSHLVWPLEDVAVIEKCNAVIVVATVAIDTHPDFVRQMILERWLELAPNLVSVLPQIEHHVGLDALEYLGQVAVGLRSVVLGDGQVYAQVVQGLRTAQDADNRHSPFLIVSRRLAALRKAVRSSTSLQEGNVSLERLAVDRIKAELSSKGSRVTLAGCGRTGRLIAEILSKETDHEIVVTNRTPLAKDGDYRNLITASWGDFDIYSTSDAVVVCLANTAETINYVERLLMAMPAGKRVLFIDMSSPSITQEIAAGPAVVRLDKLAEQATASLEKRQRGGNKARQMVEEWARELHRDLAVIAITDNQTQHRLETADPPARRRDELLRSVRQFLTDAGFVETQTSCMSPTGGVRASIQLGHVQAGICDVDRLYEIGPVWFPDAVWAPAHIDETYVLAAAVGHRIDLDELLELALGLTQRSVQDLGLASLSCRRIDYEIALEMVQQAGFSVDYGDLLDFGLLRNIADVVRFDSGEHIVAVTNCPEPAERFDVARNPKTGLGRSFRVMLDGWQVASGSLLELDSNALQRRITLSGKPVTPLDTPQSDAGADQATGTFEVALDHLLVRCTTLAEESSP